MENYESDGSEISEFELSDWENVDDLLDQMDIRFEEEDEPVHASETEESSEETM